MSDTKTLGEKQHDAQLAAHEATSNLEFAKTQVERQAKRFADAMANPDFQQAMLACWSAFGRAQRDSGLSIEDFAKALFVTEVKVSGPASVFPKEMPPCPSGVYEYRSGIGGAIGRQHADAARRLTLALYPNAEKTKSFEELLREVRVMSLAEEMRREAASHSKGCECAPCQAIAQGEERAKQMGINSVARGKVDDTDWAKRGAEKLGRIRSFAKQLESAGRPSQAMEYLSNALEREVQLSTELNLQIQANINATIDALSPEFKPYPPVCKP